MDCVQEFLRLSPMFFEIVKCNCRNTYKKLSHKRNYIYKYFYLILLQAIVNIYGKIYFILSLINPAKII